MKIALTGGTGFIGRYVIDRLLKQGHELVCWRRAESDLTGIPENDRVRWVEGSLTDPDRIAPLLGGCDALVHSAFWHPSGGFQGDVGDVATFAEANVIGSLRLFQGAIESGVSRTVYVSSCAVHDQILDDRPLDEDHPLRASNHYGAHKAAIEKFVHSFGLGQGYPICALRPTGVYGAAHPVTKSKWYDLVARVRSGQPVHCERGGKEVHASDVARAIEVLLNASDEQITGESFNCYDRYVSQWDVANLAKELSDSTATIEGKQTSPRHQIDTTKLRALGMEFGGTELLRATIEQLVTF